MIADIRALAVRHQILPLPLDLVRDDDDLWSFGLSSFACLQWMLAIEEAFEVEFAEGQVTRDGFRSFASVERLLGGLLGTAHPWAAAA